VFFEDRISARTRIARASSKAGSPSHERKAALVRYYSDEASCSYGLNNGFL
jgi:hypothetical protein